MTALTDKYVWLIIPNFVKVQSLHLSYWMHFVGLKFSEIKNKESQS